MRQNVSPKQRKTLATKIGRALKEDTKTLSKEMHEILLDDLVTAFLNRLEVLTRVKNSASKRDLTIQCSNDALEVIHGHLRQG